MKLTRSTIGSYIILNVVYNITYVVLLADFDV